MDKFMNKGLTKWSIAKNQSPDESKPADAACGKKQQLSHDYTANNNNGPWIVDDAKKGNPGALKDWGKINSMADDHSNIVNAAK